MDRRRRPRERSHSQLSTRDRGRRPSERAHYSQSAAYSGSDPYSSMLVLPSTLVVWDRAVNQSGPLTRLFGPARPADVTGAAGPVLADGDLE